MTGYRLSFSSSNVPLLPRVVRQILIHVFISKLTNDKVGKSNEKCDIVRCDEVLDLIVCVKKHGCNQ